MGMNGFIKGMILGFVLLFIFVYFMSGICIDNCPVARPPVSSVFTNMFNILFHSGNFIYWAIILIPAIIWGLASKK